MQADFRTLLNGWSRRQQMDDLESGSIDITSDEVPVFATQAKPAPPRKPKTTKTPSAVAPVVTLKPIDVGGVASITTESRKVGDAISTKFSSGAPDLLGDSGQAVWFVRPPSGGQFGPASAKLLRQWIHEGRITGDSFVWCEGWDNWQIAGDVFPAIAGKASPESITDGNSDRVTAAKTRTAYMKARRRRTIRNIVGLVIGTVVVIALVFVLLAIINNQSG